jgi:hypothetical protein
MAVVSSPYGGPSRRVVKLVKFTAFRPYTRACAPAPTAQTHQSSPTSPRAADCTIRPHETCGKQHAMPCHDALVGARGGGIE